MHTNKTVQLTFFLRLLAVVVVFQADCRRFGWWVPYEEYETDSIILLKSDAILNGNRKL